jgi:hypothetical protein
MMAEADTAASRAIWLVGVTEFFQRSSSIGVFSPPPIYHGSISGTTTLGSALQVAWRQASSSLQRSRIFTWLAATVATAVRVRSKPREVRYMYAKRYLRKLKEQVRRRQRRAGSVLRSNPRLSPPRGRVEDHNLLVVSKIQLREHG